MCSETGADPGSVLVPVGSYASPLAGHATTLHLLPGMNRATNGRAGETNSVLGESMWVCRGLAVSAALILTTSQAQADWRYCLALSDAAHRVFMSDAFASDAENGAVEGVFDQLLAQSGVQHDRVQCPRADSERQIEAMRSHAASYNREFFGRAAVDLHWAPTATFEAQRRGVDAGQK